jgi:hypothetical protein
MAGGIVSNEKTKMQVGRLFDGNFDATGITPTPINIYQPIGKRVMPVASIPVKLC